MADCKVSKTVKYVLYLSEEEAKFLTELCQNSITDVIQSAFREASGYENYEESEKTHSIRTGIFNALNNAK